MKYFIDKIKFEHVFIFTLLICMMIFYFVPSELEVSTKVVVAIVGAFGTTLGYIVGRAMPDKE